MPESQDFELSTNQEPRPPQTNHMHDSDVVAAEDGGLSKDLWMHAYEALKLRNPDLVTDYERHLSSADINHTACGLTSLSPERIKAIIIPKLEDREANRLVVRLGSEPIKVREQGEKIVRFILWSNRYISAAVSTQPFAALAWTGVSILLHVSYAMIQSQK